VFNYHALFPFLLSEYGTRARGADFNFHAPEGALPLLSYLLIFFPKIFSSRSLFALSGLWKYRTIR
jgi:hypothetical protein